MSFIEKAIHVATNQMFCYLCLVYAGCRTCGMLAWSRRQSSQGQDKGSGEQAAFDCEFWRGPRVSQEVSVKADH